LSLAQVDAAKVNGLYMIGSQRQPARASDRLKAALVRGSSMHAGSQSSCISQLLKTVKRSALSTPTSNLCTPQKKYRPDAERRRIAGFTADRAGKSRTRALKHRDTPALVEGGDVSRVP
jgi:hypothetical protein